MPDWNPPNIPDHNRSPDDPIWTDDELVEFTRHGKFEVRDWAIRRLCLQSPDRAEQVIDDLEDRVEVETSPTERVLLETPENPKKYREYADQLQEDLIQGNRPDVIDEFDRESETRTFAILAERPESVRNILEAGQTTMHLLILQHVTKQWAADLLLSRLDQHLSGDNPRLVWETFEELGDPNSIPSLLEEWKPGERHASRVVNHLYHLVGAEEQVPEPIQREVDKINELNRRIGTADNPQEMLQKLQSEKPSRYTLTCKECERTYTYEVETIYIHPDVASDEDRKWSGMLPGRIVECKNCGTADRYRLTEETFDIIYRRLSGQHTTSGGPTIQSKRWERPDGSPLKRPSEGVEEWKQYAEDHPEQADVWKQYGELASAFSMPEEAERAYRRVLELSSGDFEPLFELAPLVAKNAEEDSDRDRVLELLNRSLQKFCELSAENQRKQSGAVVETLRDISHTLSDPMILHAAWTGKPRLQSERTNGDPDDDHRGLVPLSRIDYWDGLNEFLGFAELEHLSIEIGEAPETNTPLRSFLDEISRS